MKIAWFCIPAHGHTNPTLGLVREMTTAGHEVFYFSFDMFREKIEKVGANYISCDGYDLDIEDKDAADRVGKDMRCRHGWMQKIVWKHGNFGVDCYVMAVQILQYFQKM